MAADDDTRRDSVAPLHETISAPLPVIAGYEVQSVLEAVIDLRTADSSC
jgi:hypothetical protein